MDMDVDNPVHASQSDEVTAQHNEYDFTAEEEELLVALLNQYNAQLNGGGGSSNNSGDDSEPRPTATNSDAATAYSLLGQNNKTTAAAAGTTVSHAGRSSTPPQQQTQQHASSRKPDGGFLLHDRPPSHEYDEGGLAVREHAGPSAARAASHYYNSTGSRGPSNARDITRYSSSFRSSSQQQQQQPSPLPSASQQSSNSLGSLLSFASSAALDELLDNAIFPTEVQVTVPSSQTAIPSISPSQGEPAKPEVDLTPGLTAENNNAEASQSRQDEQRQQRKGKDPSPDPNLPPIARWRSYKPLSVTDLVSPAWCELQYSLSLTHYGRKKRTPAMKKGSAVHQQLEDEVHATFQVAVLSREDAWALRLWNIIQGARTLRETGITRELEVWGVVRGQLVNGIIDELSYDCPDEELEQQAKNEAAEPGTDEKQQTIEDFFRGRISGSTKKAALAKQKQQLVYLTDVKTRTVRSLPRGSSFRPTAMQLMIYHRMLSDLAAGKVDPQLVFERYKLDPTAPFSDSFIAQFAPEETPSNTQASSDSYPSQDAQPRHDWLGAPSSSIPSTAHTSESPLTDAASQAEAIGSQQPSIATQSTEPTPLTESLEDIHTLLRRHNTLTSLWDVMLAELGTAVPDGLGGILTAEYRTQGDEREVIGTKSFLLDDKALDGYLDKIMAWWTGERKPEGVCVEEAWKCGSCEFADGCEWRKEKVEEAIRKSRARNKTVRHVKAG